MLHQIKAQQFYKDLGLCHCAKFNRKYTMHNKFSNYLCSHLFGAHLCAVLINFNCNDENRDLRQMKTRNFRHHPLNRHLGRAGIAEGASKQKSHPL